MSWQLISKVKIQINPSLRQIQTKGLSYDMKRKVPEASKRGSQSSFWWSKQEEVKNRSTSESLEHLPSSSWQIPWFCALFYHFLQTNIKHGLHSGKTDRLVSLREPIPNSNCVTNMTGTARIMLCLSPVLSDLSTLTLTHTSVPISPADHGFGIRFGGHYYNDLNAKSNLFFFLHLLFDFTRKFCSLLDLERGRPSWNEMQEKVRNKWIQKSRTP